jgi:hypothetical protein
VSESLCECGHKEHEHPYVGRFATWPTRCYYCECLAFKPQEARQSQSMERETAYHRSEDGYESSGTRTSLLVRRARLREDVSPTGGLGHR